jgi:hypothetical protein
MEKAFINPACGIVNITANDFQPNSVVTYHKERTVKIFGHKIKTVPAYILEFGNLYSPDKLDSQLKIIDNVVYYKPHVWINFNKREPYVKYFETYQEAIDYATEFAEKYALKELTL